MADKKELNPEEMEEVAGGNASKFDLNKYDSSLENPGITTDPVEPLPADPKHVVMYPRNPNEQGNVKVAGALEGAFNFDFNDKKN